MTADPELVLARVISAFCPTVRAPHDPTSSLFVIVFKTRRVKMNNFFGCDRSIRVLGGLLLREPLTAAFISPFTLLKAWLVLLSCDVELVLLDSLEPTASRAPKASR